MSPALAGGFFTTEPSGKPVYAAAHPEKQIVCACVCVCVCVCKIFSGVKLFLALVEPVACGFGGQTSLQ